MIRGSAGGAKGIGGLTLWVGGNQFCGGGQKMETKLYMHYRKC